MRWVTRIALPVDWGINEQIIFSIALQNDAPIVPSIHFGERIEDSRGLARIVRLILFGDWIHIQNWTASGVLGGIEYVSVAAFPHKTC